MNRDEQKEIISLVIILAVAGCTFAVLAVTRAEPALYIFSLPLLFILMGLTPAAWSKLFNSGSIIPARLSLTLAVGTLPFYVLFSTNFPYPAGVIAMIIVFLTIEGIYWAFLYRAGALFYSSILFITGFIPLLIYSFIMHTSDAGLILAISPLGYLYFLCRNEWSIHIVSILTAHAVPLICAIILVLLSRKHAGSSSDES